MDALADRAKAWRYLVTSEHPVTSHATGAFADPPFRLFFAGRVVPTVSATSGRPVGRRHRQSVTAVALSADDKFGFSASKDGQIFQFDITTGETFPLPWPDSEPTTSGRPAEGGGRGSKGKPRDSRHLLALAVSSDGCYLAAGGMDRKVHLWDLRTRQHCQAFPGHRGAITGLKFRDGTLELFSASLDRSIKVWSVAQRAYLDSLYGHQSEVVALDCLRQERVLSAGRDRTCRIWKVWAGGGGRGWGVALCKCQVWAGGRESGPRGDSAGSARPLSLHRLLRVCDSQ